MVVALDATPASQVKTESAVPPARRASVGMSSRRARRTPVPKQLAFPTSDGETTAMPRRRRTRTSSVSSTSSCSTHSSISSENLSADDAVSSWDPSALAMKVSAFKPTYSDTEDSRLSPVSSSPSMSPVFSPIPLRSNSGTRKRRRTDSVSPLDGIGFMPNIRPAVLAPAKPLYLTTYATVSASERKTFRSEEWKNRPTAQRCLKAPPVPPVGIVGLLGLNDLDTWPLVRIGETFQILFRPSTNVAWTESPSTQYGGLGHAAVRFGFNNAMGSSITSNNGLTSGMIQFENYFWDAMIQKSRCLRCTHVEDECVCNHANDLLQTCHQRMGDRCEVVDAGDGLIGIMLRIPRTRKPIMGVKPNNNWMKMLPKPPGGDIRTPKTMEIRIIEETVSAYGEVSREVHRGFVRLAAKNGAIRLKQGLCPTPSPVDTSPIAPEKKKFFDTPPVNKGKAVPTSNERVVSKPIVQPLFHNFVSLNSPPPIRSPCKLESLMVAVQLERERVERP